MAIKPPATAFSLLLLLASCGGDPIKSADGPDSDTGDDENNVTDTSEQEEEDTESEEEDTDSEEEEIEDTEVDTDTEEEEEEDTDSDPGMDYTLSGGTGHTTTDGTFTTTTGCTLSYTRYLPDSNLTDKTVVMMHGFLRNKDRFAGWGTHLASWDVPSLAVTMCNSAMWNADADANAADVLELMDHLTLQEVFYMGHSNGGISAIQAASLDGNALGALGLDPVENFGTDHTPQAASLSVPAYTLVGESSSCNDSNSGVAAFKAAPKSSALLVSEAGHCDFESPTDALCQVAPGCSGTNNTFSDEEIQNTVIGLGTAFMRWSLFSDADGKDWWTPGKQAYEGLLNSGAIQPL